VDPGDPNRFFNRELSWLDFNARVLAQAEDGRLPLLERVKFCAIFGQNLDEFFQVRVAGLKDKVSHGRTGPSPDGMSPSTQLAEISGSVTRLVHRLEAVLTGEILPALAAERVTVVDWASLGEEDRKFLTAEFENRIFSILTPLAVDPGHPFPYLSNLSISLGVLLGDPETGDRHFARLKVPLSYGRFLTLPDGERFIPIERVISAHLESLFSGLEIREKVVFRVTRNADLAVDERESDDLLTAIEAELRQRRFGNVVRLEIERPISVELRDLLVDELELGADDVYVSPVLLDVAGLWQLYALDRDDLKAPGFSPVVPEPLRDVNEDVVDLFHAIRLNDILVHHPYTSFDGTVAEFIRQAASDPHVLALKCTLYRTSGDSPLVDSLIRAAEHGKQVAVVVELKARFDEAANIEWARALERVGVHVAYGLVGLKVHAKTCLVVRDEADGLRRYCHIGTGNYNSKTARVYEDLGLFTCDPEIGDDLSHLFNSLTGYGHDIDYQRLVVAPRFMRTRVTELIKGEIARGPGGAITLKMNSLVDPPLIDLLYEASQAGVDIDLIVRGICCLRPGVPGLSENIRVRSLVGRYLEHSRIYRFANGSGDGKPVHLIGSGDLMPRNLDRRIECLVPVEVEALQAELDSVLAVNLADETLAWALEPDGRWERVSEAGGLNAHDEFERSAH
jgi:polyphosphate kinase